MPEFAISQADIFARTFTEQEYIAHFARIANIKGNQHLTQDLTLIGSVKRAIYKIAEFLGFSKFCNVYWVNSAFLKFIYYGLSQGFFLNPTIRALAVKMTKNSAITLSPEFRNAVLRLSKEYAEIEDADSARGYAQRQLLHYHNTHNKHLQPAFWKRTRCHSLQVVSTRPEWFGATPLKLASQHIAKKQFNLAMQQLEYTILLNDRSLCFAITTRLQELKKCVIPTPLQRKMSELFYLVATRQFLSKEYKLAEERVNDAFGFEMDLNQKNFALSLKALVLKLQKRHKEASNCLKDLPVTSDTRFLRRYYDTINESKDDDELIDFHERFKRTWSQPGYVHACIRRGLEWSGKVKSKLRSVIRLFSADERSEQAKQAVKYYEKALPLLKEDHLSEKWIMGLFNCYEFLGLQDKIANLLVRLQTKFPNHPIIEKVQKQRMGKSKT